MKLKDLEEEDIKKGKRQTDSLSCEQWENSVSVICIKYDEFRIRISLEF